MSAAPTHVWVSKHALSDGKVTRCEISRHNGDSVELVDSYGQFYLGSDCHLTRISATMKAILMREEKIRSHERSIKRLRKLSFADDAP